MLGLAAILSYLTWVYGGLRASLLPPAVWFSTALLIVVLVTSGGSLKAGCIERDNDGARCWCRDPFFYTGLLFIVYLALQWWNAGRVQYYDVGYNRWTYSLPPHPGWPSAFNRNEAAQMIHWFFPAWVSGLVVRSPLVSRDLLKRLLLFLVYSAGGLALLGIAQFLSGTKQLYWLDPMQDGFFASFGYTNHAAAYFVLMGAMAAGFLFREILFAGAMQYAVNDQADDPCHRSAMYGASSKRHQGRIVLLVVSLFLCLTGANLSLSRAGVILAWSLAVFIAVYGLKQGWHRITKVARVNLVMATVAVFCVFYFAVAGFGSKSIGNEFKPNKPIHHNLFPVLDDVNLALSNRPELDAAAIQVWLDHKWQGVGGWGYRYLLALYMPQDTWERLGKTYGNANVHCDPLQFLVEFGVIGSGLMSMTLLVLLVDLVRNTRHRHPVWIMSVIGLCLVVVFSLIDLPFRCPAILITWVVILASLPKLTLYPTPKPLLTDPRTLTPEPSLSPHCTNGV